MSERYKILDSIMANPDPMIRQRLEMAYDAGRVSVLHEKKVFADDKDFDCAVTFHTAFTNRDIATLTARIAELERENKDLREALTMAIECDLHQCRICRGIGRETLDQAGSSHK